MSRYLLHGRPELDAFLDGMLRDNSLRATFGDAEKLKVIDGTIIAASGMMRDSVDTLLRLAKDRTKSEPERHAAAQRVAGQLNGFLKQKAAEIRNLRDQLDRDAHKEARDTISLSNLRANHDVMAAAWIKEQMGKGPDGLDAIKAVATKEPFASTLFNFEPEFLGMTGANSKTLDSMRLDIWKLYSPDSYAKAQTWAALDGYPERYEKAGREFTAAAFEPNLAMDASTKVNV